MAFTSCQHSTDHAIKRTLNKAIQRTMQVISANTLKNQQAEDPWHRCH
jgi:uncharacterized phage-associated protein